MCKISILKIHTAISRDLRLVPKEDGTSVWLIAISFLEDSTVAPFPEGGLKEHDILFSVNLLKAIDVKHLG